jgi:hypothetical protein
MSELPPNNVHQNLMGILLMVRKWMFMVPSPSVVGGQKATPVKKLIWSCSGG